MPVFEVILRRARAVVLRCLLGAACSAVARLHAADATAAASAEFFLLLIVIKTQLLGKWNRDAPIVNIHVFSVLGAFKSTRESLNRKGKLLPGKIAEKRVPDFRKTHKKVDFFSGIKYDPYLQL